MYYGPRYHDPSTALIIFAVIALILTILSFIFITPRSKKERLNGFFRWLHEIFNFDALLIDKILKFLYIFSTLLAILEGFVLLFSGTVSGLICLMIILLGPVAIRLVFESMMMFVILVRNVSEINRKMGGMPAKPAAPRPEVRLCPQCGKKLNPGAAFCGNCGYSVKPAPKAPAAGHVDVEY